MKRIIEQSLLEWKVRTERKPLLLRGARQVGKTWVVRRLGETFETFIECNFEQDRGLAKLFQGDLGADRLCERLAAYTGKSIVPGSTLLFLDEIQACPDALRALRFFYEQRPALHVVAAGSLLEFSLAEIPSFGVGRVESLYLFPINFQEFLMARGEVQVLEEALRERQEGCSPFHEKLVDALRVYMAIGGFPEVVQHYMTHRDLPKCGHILDDLYSSLQDDFSKYRTRVPGTRLNETFHAVMAQAGGKFVYTRVSPALDHHQAKAALELLILAGLAYAVVHTSGQGIPIGAQTNLKWFKVIPCDLGLYHRILGLPLADLLFADEKSTLNKGAAAEIFAGLELLVAQTRRRKASLFYWQKLKHDGNAEVDYVVQKGMEIIPVEVKAGTRGAMQSLRIFLESHPESLHAIRTSLEPFGRIDERIEVVPLYALGDYFKTGDEE